MRVEDAVFPGADVGKGEHHACTLNRLLNGLVLNGAAGHSKSL
ncbi:hypothetical protein ACN3XK_73385 [Actinomadura welshii]